MPPAVEPTEIVRAAESATPPVAEFAAPPAVEIAKAVQAAEVTEAVDSAPVKPVKPAATAYKGGEQYGPVAPNERLWDIAAKVRPAPDIGIDTMMRALFAINPSAFAKAGMDYLKVGVILRVPTLREIVDHTHSKVVKQLLEQQATTSKEVGPADSTQTPLPPPPAAASTTGSEPEPKPEPRSSAVN